MTENPLIKVLSRLADMARLHGTVYAEVTWDADKGMYNFAFILPKHITVSYEEKKDD